MPGQAARRIVRTLRSGTLTPLPASSVPRVPAVLRRGLPRPFDPRGAFPRKHFFRPRRPPRAASRRRISTVRDRVGATVGGDGRHRCVIGGSAAGSATVPWTRRKWLAAARRRTDQRGPALAHTGPVRQADDGKGAAGRGGRTSTRWTATWSGSAGSRRGWSVRRRCGASCRRRPAACSTSVAATDGSSRSSSTPGPTSIGLECGLGADAKRQHQRTISPWRSSGHRSQFAPPGTTDRSSKVGSAATGRAHPPTTHGHWDVSRWCRVLSGAFSRESSCSPGPLGLQEIPADLGEGAACRPAGSVGLERPRRGRGTHARPCLVGCRCTGCGCRGWGWVPRPGAGLLTQSSGPAPTQSR